MLTFREKSTGDSKNEEITIINLSAVVNWNGVTAGLSAFANLCKMYAPKPSWCCSRTLFGLSNYAWVAIQYQTHSKTLIEPYKLGKIDHTAFFEGVLNIFSFLKDCTFPNDVKQRIFDHRNHFLSLQNTHATTANALTSHEIAVALLEEAWNAPVDFNAEVINRLRYILKTVKEGNTVIFISNTSSSTANDIIQKMVELFPDVAWDHKPDLSASHTDKKPIRFIAPHVGECFSFQVGQFKTPGLIKLTKDHLNSGKLTLVSQFPGDITEAEKLGIKTQSPKDYFEKIPHTKKLK